MHTRSAAAFLFVSGLLLLAIGAAILLTPNAFFATNGIVVGTDPSQLSEVRAPGGLLTASALVLLVAAFRSIWRTQALRLAVLVYGSFGVARLLGMALDGLPTSGLVVSTAIELAVAAVGAALLVRSGDAPARIAPATAAAR